MTVHRALDDPVDLARAAQIIRAALARQNGHETAAETTAERLTGDLSAETEQAAQNG